MQGENLVNKKVLLRLDLNCDFLNLEEDHRFKAGLHTISKLIEQKAIITIISHRGRPQAGHANTKLSLHPLIKALEKELSQKVFWQPNWPHNRVEHDCQVELAENTRFLVGEVENDSGLAQKMAQGYDLFIMDAFGCAHRAHASVANIAKFVRSLKGPLVNKELNAINGILNNQFKKIILVVGGAKIESKLPLLERMLPYVQTVLVGGGVANTFIASQGLQVGRSLCDYDFLPDAQAILSKTSKIVLPCDVVCEAKAKNKLVKQVTEEDRIFDIGAQTSYKYCNYLKSADAIIWAGPLGFVENNNFAQGTQDLCNALAKSSAFTLIGGGDTLSCMQKLNKDGLRKIDVISTGGGAFLAALTGKLTAFDYWELYEKN